MKKAYFAISIIAIFTFFAACKNQNSKMDLNTIKSKIPLQIPEDVTEVKSYREQGIDELIVLSFRLNQQQLSDFLQQNSLEETLTHNQRPFSDIELRKLEWWRPDQLVKNVQGGSTIHTDWAQEILIGELDEADGFVVFYKFFTL